jgi:hypothetical protein
LQGSLLEAKNKPFLKDLLGDNKQEEFKKLFMEGCENITIDT